MKHFYLKSVFALIIIVLTLGAAIRLVYPDNAKNDLVKAKNQIIRTLSNGNVRISSDLLNFETQEVFDCTMDNALNINSLAKQFLGKSAVRADDYTYYSNSGSVTFKEFHMSYTPKNPIFSADTKYLTLSNAADITARLCAEYGISTSDTQFGVSGSENKISVSVMYRIDSRPVFNNALVMELTTAGLQTVSGNYYTPSNARTNIRYAKRMEDALIDFMNECTDKSRETVITDIQLGYLLNDTTSQTTTISPVWRIIVENTAVYYVSA